MNTATQVAPASTAPKSRLGLAWVLLSLSVAAHVIDEALTGFLSVYNPTVRVLRARIGFWPMPTFEYRTWLTALIVGVVLMFAFSPFVYRGARWIRPIFYFLAAVMIANAGGHILFTILGRTVSAVRFSRPAPGFYSSPLLLAASIYAMIELRKTAKSRRLPQ